MPCKDALIAKVLTLTPDQTVEKALESLSKAGAVFAPVVESDGTLAGLFSIVRLLENTLPVSVAVNMAGGPASVAVPAAPGMAKRLQKYRVSKVSEMMQRPAQAVHPDTPLEAAVRHIRECGEPAVVVDPSSGAFLGVVTETSLLAALEKI